MLGGREKSPMEVQKVQDCRARDGAPVPAYLITPDTPPKGAAVIGHGYSSCKEMLLGLGLKLAEAGWASLVIDLRGHGENQEPFGEGVLDDLDGALAYMKQKFPGLAVAAIGHSLSGRLALMSEADLVVALSPAVPSKPSLEGREVLTKLSATKVRQDAPDAVLKLLQALGPVPDKKVPTLILKGEGDIPSLIEGMETVKTSLSRATLEPISHHQLPQVPLEGDMKAYLPRWLNHVELPLNAQVYEKVANWLSQKTS
jgi:dienelactone hydrolase